MREVACILDNVVVWSYIHVRLGKQHYIWNQHIPRCYHRSYLSYQLELRWKSKWNVASFNAGINYKKSIANSLATAIHEESLIFVSPKSLELSTLKVQSHSRQVSQTHLRQNFASNCSSVFSVLPLDPQSDLR